MQNKRFQRTAHKVRRPLNRDVRRDEMKPKYKTRIEGYCKANGIAVPGGFGRNTPSRYVLVRSDFTPAKIVATTWFKQEDVVYYFRNFIIPEIGDEKAKQLDVLDFELCRRLRFNGSSSLVAIDVFMKNTSAEQSVPGYAAQGASSPEP